MMEVVAGLLLAIAALLWVLEPLVRSARPRYSGGATAEALISEMRARLVSVCPSCATPAEPGAVYCRSCGRLLVADR